MFAKIKPTNTLDAAAFFHTTLFANFWPDNSLNDAVFHLQTSMK